MVVGSIMKVNNIHIYKGNSNERPWINLTWSVQILPLRKLRAQTHNRLMMRLPDTSTHALLPKTNNTLKWSHPNQSNVDDWRIYVWSDYTDERAGWDVYDSRTSTQGWDLTNLTWTPSTGFAAGKSYQWFVQPITDDIFGAKMTIFHILRTQVLD